MDRVRYKVGVTQPFIQMIRLPNTELQRILDGKPQSKSSVNVQRMNEKRLKKEMELIEAVKDKHGGYKKFFTVLDQAKNDPEGAASYLEPYVQDLLKLGQDIHHVELLDIGYKVNHLTIALVRLKRYEQAFEWLNSYFLLPDRYLRKPDSSLNKQLRKRFYKLYPSTD